MSSIQVLGLQALKGEINIQGSKNAVLPMMAASVLHKGVTVISNVPRIQDVFCMMGILEHLGCECRLNGQELVVDATSLVSVQIPDARVKQMRSSIILLGALLSRCGEAITHYPGGCSIGARPIDLHLKALRSLGASITEENGRIQAAAPALKGATIHFPFPSVGATENALLGAVAAEGTTRILGAAREPEIIEFCRFLNGMGAVVFGAGTSELVVRGRAAFHDSCFRAAGDRIVAGTYMGAVMAAGGETLFCDVPVEHMRSVLEYCRAAGASIRVDHHQLLIRMKVRPDAISFKTGPYPGFPTDLQSVMMAAMTVSQGEAIVEESVFEDRFETAKELERMGAEIRIDGRLATVKGGKLKGALVTARDLRGGAALVVAGLAAEGVTEVSDCRHIERGYQDICSDLSGIGAEIRYKTD